jgi:hypothetical protein
MCNSLFSDQSRHRAVSEIVGKSAERGFALTGIAAFAIVEKRGSRPTEGSHYELLRLPPFRESIS